MENEMVVLDKICVCGNHIVLIGSWNMTERSSSVKVKTNPERDYGDLPAGLVGKGSVRCKCGKLYRGVNFSEFHRDMLGL
jgi:hypothetical protein